MTPDTYRSILGTRFNMENPFKPSAAVERHVVDTELVMRFETRLTALERLLRAKTIGLDRWMNTGSEEVMEGYGGERWSAGRSMAVQRNAAALVCDDGFTVTIPSSMAEMGREGSKLRTINAIRDFTDSSYAELKRQFEDLYGKLTDEEKMTMRERMTSLGSLMKELDGRIGQVALSGEASHRVKEEERIKKERARWGLAEDGSVPERPSSKTEDIASEAVPSVKKEKHVPKEVDFAKELEKKAERKAEREMTLTERLGSSLAEKASLLLGETEAIRLIRRESDAPYGRARRQEAIRQALKGAEGLEELYGITKAAVFDGILEEASKILTERDVQHVAPVVERSDTKKHSDTEKSATLGDLMGKFGKKR